MWEYILYKISDLNLFWFTSLSSNIILTNFERSFQSPPSGPETAVISATFRNKYWGKASVPL